MCILIWLRLLLVVEKGWILLKKETVRYKDSVLVVHGYLIEVQEEDLIYLNDQVPVLFRLCEIRVSDGGWKWRL